MSSESKVKEVNIDLDIAQNAHIHHIKVISDKLGIHVGDLHGYEHEEYTHLAVAAAISSGRADCGLGIAAAAQALDLDFIPLFLENYELVIPTQFFNSPLLTPFFEVLDDPEVRQAIATLPGYDTSQMGTIVADVS